MGEPHHSSKRPRLEVDNGEEWDMPEYSSGSDSNDSDCYYSPIQPFTAMDKSGQKKKRPRRSSGYGTRATLVTRLTTTDRLEEAKVEVCPLTLLPIELWVKIFQMAMWSEGSVPFVYKLEQVCTAWSRISENPILRLHAVNLSGRLYSGFISKWLQSSQISHCRDINLTSCQHASLPIVISALSDHCPDLQALNLSFTTLQTLTSNCHKIQRLVLNYTKAPVNAVRNLLKTSTLLKEVRMAGSDIGLSLDALSQCNHLEVLEVENTIINASDVEQLHQTCPALRIIRLLECCGQVGHLTGICQGPGFVNLEELCCSTKYDSEVFNSIVLNSLVHNASKLRVLNLMVNFNPWEMRTIRMPSPTIKSLEELGLGCGRINPDFLSWLPMAFEMWGNTLRVLDCSGIAAPPGGLNTVFRAAYYLPPCALTHLNLASRSVDHTCVLTVLEIFRDLRVLDLKYCWCVSGDFQTVHTGPSALARLRVRLQSVCAWSIAEEYSSEPDYN